MALYHRMWLYMTNGIILINIPLYFAMGKEYCMFYCNNTVKYINSHSLICLIYSDRHCTFLLPKFTLFNTKTWPGAHVFTI